MSECTERNFAVAQRSAVRGWQSDGARPGRDVRLSPLRAVTPLGGRSKRCVDLFVSILLLPIAALLALPIACLIAFAGSRPIYSHLRVGWNGRIFRCYKFRTMVAASEDKLRTIIERDPAARQQWLQHYKLADDPRVTRLGHFLRATNLDELPQIWNVLRGEMSLVGPRPVVPEELEKYTTHLSAYFACRPGITGLWQIRRRSNTTYDERVALDVQYALGWSMMRDVAILVRTIPWMLTARYRG